MAEFISHFLVGVGRHLHANWSIWSNQRMQTQAAGKASAYSYVQIVLSALLGVWVFNEIPSIWTYLGGGLIVTGALINVFGKQLLTPFKAR